MSEDGRYPQSRAHEDEPPRPGHDEHGPAIPTQSDMFTVTDKFICDEVHKTMELRIVRKPFGFIDLQQKTIFGKRHMWGHFVVEREEWVSVPVVTEE